jgi:hypothetical protein
VTVPDVDHRGKYVNFIVVTKMEMLLIHTNLDKVNSCYILLNEINIEAVMESGNTRLLEFMMWTRVRNG